MDSSTQIEDESHIIDTASDEVAKAHVHQAESPYARKYFNHNYRYGITNGILYNLGTTFFSATTIVPAFLASLTDSNFLISVASLLMPLGWFLPQVIVASYVQHKPRIMPLYNLSAVLRSIALIGLVVATLFFHNSPAILLVAFFVFFGLFTLSSGIGGLAFFEILAKAFTPSERGSFIGWRIALGGIFGALAGPMIISRVLAEQQFPYGFITLFIIGTVTIIVSLFTFSAIKEPRQIHLPPKRTLGVHLKESFAIVGRDKKFRTFLLLRFVMTLWMMGHPFYALFAQRELGADKSILGLFITYELVGGVVSNLFWSKISRSTGNARVLRFAAALTMIAPVMVLLSFFVSMPLAVYALVFAANGAWDAATNVGGVAYIVELAPQNERPMYVGVTNSLLAISVALSTLGGFFLDMTSFIALYALLTVLALVSLRLSFRLTEPRYHVTTAGV